MPPSFFKEDCIVDLKRRQITVGELLVNPKARRILGRNFPELMNPFLLNVAQKMTLENTLKLAVGPYAPEQVSSIISDLEAI